eukprot:4170207-Prymnesium_polylepis.1
MWPRPCATSHSRGLGCRNVDVPTTHKAPQKMIRVLQPLRPCRVRAVCGRPERNAVSTHARTARGS